MSDPNAKPSPIEIPHDQISQRAYELWQARGCPDGAGESDWLEATAQLEAEARRDSLRSTAFSAESDAAPSRSRGPLKRLYDRWRQRAAL